MELQGQRIGLSEMINAMAAQGQIYTVPAYRGLEAAYAAQYPQYVTQVTHGAYIATSAPPAPQQVIAHTTHDPYEALAPVTYVPEEPARPRERREHRDHDREKRDRERDREYRDRRERDRDRDRERRDRDRDRERDRDRDRDRDRYRDEERERSSRSREREHRDRDYDRERESIYEDDVRGLDYKNMPPNNTIMVRGLAQHITENDIRADILACALMPKDIRLVRKKDSGASRGFAFVEFTTVHDATRWMEAKQGVLILQDVYRATLQYSIPKDAADKQNKQSQDWFCIRCGAHNFKRRDSCFKCSSSRTESEAGEEGSDEVCNYPTNLLLLRGLDVLSTEESVLQSIEPVSSDLPIRSVRIGRDPLTNTSRGVCYVELNSVLDSMQLYNKLVENPPIIDNKETSISYCKLNQGGSQNTAHQNHHQPIEYTAGADIKKLAEYSAAVYAQTPEEHAAYVEYYTLYYQQQAQASSGTQSDSVNAAAAVAQSALQAMQQKVSGGSAAVAASAAAQISYATTNSSASFSSNMVNEDSQDASEYPKYPTPDVANYTYDESSGYYYDSSTGLYYDASSSYYYNAETGHYLYWDAEKSTYMPASTSEDSQDNSSGGFKDKRDKDGKDKQDKVKVAKKIAKDMERWAKAQNKRNETSVKPMSIDPVGGNVSDGLVGSGAADAAFAVLLERRERPTLDKNQTFQMHMKKEERPTLGNLKKSGLVAAYGGEGSDSEDEKEVPQNDISAERPEKLVDVAKLACLLCKRQFPNKDSLTKHIQLSNLHKSNLEALNKRNREAASLSMSNQSQYRDRAKERRQKYGLPNAPPPNKLKERYIAARDEAPPPVPPEERSREALDNSIGSKMMKKMGWTDGMGLGKSNQGRTNIIEAERRVSSAGLGMQGSSYSAVGDSYKDCVKKMMFHRYQELDAIERGNGN